MLFLNTTNHKLHLRSGIELITSSTCTFVSVVISLRAHLQRLIGRDPLNQNSNPSDREKRTTSKRGPVFSKLFRLDRTDPLRFGPKFPEILVEWIAPIKNICAQSWPVRATLRDRMLEDRVFWTTRDNSPF